ncbi:helix-turn-helix domain-containing protein [Phreatobacter stygius]|nr:helix-turn-helix domain-containing protein [Phreatobacter stygius]
MTERRTYLPPRLMEIAEAAGTKAALSLGVAYAGRRFYVPKRLGQQHPLTQLLGLEAARKLVSLFGGETVLIPPALAGEARRRREAIIRMSAAGASQTEIAHALGIDRTTVQRNQQKARGGPKLAKARGRRGQDDLFD